MKKDGEYTALKENLDGVIRMQQELKNNLEVAMDQDKFLNSEKRKSVIDLHSSLTVWVGKLNLASIYVGQRDWEEISQRLTALLEENFESFLKLKGHFELFTPYDKGIDNTISDLQTAIIGYHSSIMYAETAIQDAKIKKLDIYQVKIQHEQKIEASRDRVIAKIFDTRDAFHKLLNS